MMPADPLHRRTRRLAGMEEPVTLQMTLVGRDFLVFCSDRKFTQVSNAALPEALISHAAANKFAIHGDVICGFAGGPHASRLADALLDASAGSLPTDALECRRLLFTTADAFNRAPCANPQDEITVIDTRHLRAWLVIKPEAPYPTAIEEIETSRVSGDNNTLARFLVEHLYASNGSSEHFFLLATLVLWYGRAENPSAIGEDFDLFCCTREGARKVPSSEVVRLRETASRFDVEIRNLFRRLSEH